MWPSPDQQFFVDVGGELFPENVADVETQLIVHQYGGSFDLTDVFCGNDKSAVQLEEFRPGPGKLQHIFKGKVSS